MAIILIFLLPLSLFGTDLGSYGHLYPIQEENFLEYLKCKLNNFSKKELQILEQDLRDNYIKSAKEPNGKYLPSCKKDRTFYYDPTVHSPKDIIDNTGNIIVKKGTSFNPLSKTKLQENLIFFDGHDPKQVNWALSQTGKYILTKGSPVDFEDKYKIPFYFDQAGKLIDRLKICSLPAIVSQKGLRLKIREIALDD